MHRILLLLILLTPFAMAETVAYGEDPFILGLGLDAYALGHVRALPLNVTSLGANGAHLDRQDSHLAYQHSEGFGGVYQTDVIYAGHGNWNLALFRGGISGIADTRDALQDYGTDGQPNTNDADGSEGNGELDPGERLSINEISFFSTQQLVVEGGYNRILGRNLAVHGTARLLYHDLYTQSGFGVGFHAGLVYQPLPALRLGLQVTDLLTTTVFWSEGRREQYPPQLFLGVDYNLVLKQVPFTFRPVFEYQLSPFIEEAGLASALSYGVEIGFQNQLMVQMGRDPYGSLSLGALIRTRYLDLQYATSLSAIRDAGGPTHRVGASFQLSQFIKQGN